MAYQKEEKDKLKEVTDKLEQGVKEIFDSERFKECLRVMAKFTDYSINNQILIAMQKPYASLVAGYKAWQTKFGRYVKKGEKGIKIIAPSPFKVKKDVTTLDEDGKSVTEEKEIQIMSYKAITVFDVSQTEGKELSSIQKVSVLTGEVENFDKIFEAIKSVSPVPISIENIGAVEGVKGYYSPKEKRIVINEGLSQAHTLKTAIHEVTHSKLHDVNLDLPKEERPKRDKFTEEVQAESVAFVVCQSLGLDTSDYSFGYIAGWSSGKDTKELKNSLEIIRTTANEIINGIDELTKAEEKTNDNSSENEVKKSKSLSL